MTNEEFMMEVEKSFIRSKKVLMKKEKEYSSDRDRLDQFYRAGRAQNFTPTMALIAMAMKHVTSIADMSKAPLDYDIKQWDEKIGDLRNYTFLLDALVRDMKEKVTE